MSDILQQIETIQRQNIELDKMNDEQVNELIKGSILLQRLKAKVESLEAVKADLQNVANNEALRHQTTYKHLSSFLDEQEGIFDSTGDFASEEICQNYIEAAKWAESWFGRKHNRIQEAEQWLYYGRTL